jgi:hypothetical protein
MAVTDPRTAARFNLPVRVVTPFGRRRGARRRPNGGIFGLDPTHGESVPSRHNTRVNRNAAGRAGQEIPSIEKNPIVNIGA